MPRHHKEQDDRRSEGARVKALREALGLSQRELAQRFGVGASAIALWETGERTLPGPAIKLLSLYEAEIGLGGPSSVEPRWWKRSLRLAGTAAGIGVMALGATLEEMIEREHSPALTRDVQTAAAKRLVGSLGELKGLAMKLGQMMSYLDPALPKEMRDELSSLQSQAPAMGAAAVTDVLLAEFEKTPRQLFADWDPKPIAAASLGQVHRAVLHSGEQVAVKVQYPKIVEALEADLRNAHLLDSVASLVLRGAEKGNHIRELRDRMREECDYRLEAKNQQEFRALFAGDEQLVIPRVFPEFSSRRVLTTELVEGAQSFTEFSAHATQAQKDCAAVGLWRFAFEPPFRARVLQADPNPGNFLFRDGRIFCVDFGCVKRLPPEFIVRWSALLKATRAHDDAAMDRLMVEMGVVLDPALFDFRPQREMTYAVHAPWTEGRFRFTPAYVTDLTRQMVVDNPNKFAINHPRDWLFVNRLLWGLYALLGDLHAEADWSAALKVDPLASA